MAPVTGRASAVLVIAASLLIVGFMAAHPTSHAPTLRDFAVEATGGFGPNALVHGVLVGLAALLCVGFLALADALGWRRLVVRAAVVSLALGTVCGVFAGGINGFVVPTTAAAYAEADDATLAALGVGLRFAREANATLARGDVIGVSAATILFGLAALRGAASTRRPVLGIVGLALGVAPLALLAAGRLPITVSGFGHFVLMQGFWGIAVGVSLLRRSM